MNTNELLNKLLDEYDNSKESWLLMIIVLIMAGKKDIDYQTRERIEKLVKERDKNKLKGE